MVVVKTFKKIAKLNKQEITAIASKLHCKLIEELKEEVIIAVIDDSFNTPEFIEKQISKFIY